MAMNPIPPQAYTKDTMLKAYAWLQHQSTHIKEMATTPDILVSLFLKATRDGDSSLDRPSIVNFKNELKNIAGLMGELDQGNSSPTNKLPPLTEAPRLASEAQGLPQDGIDPRKFVRESLTTDLDPRTQEVLLEIQKEMNLSSPLEALRLLIQIGYKACKKNW